MYSTPSYRAGGRGGRGQGERGSVYKKAHRDSDESLGCLSILGNCKQGHEPTLFSVA